MTAPQRCPACGERDELRGESGVNGIEITCVQCGHRWSRGALRCRSCGESETVSIPQVIARTSRGNQLSIMGHRDITLCPRCDAEVIATCRTARQWVPESYVSAFSFDPRDVARSSAVSETPGAQPDHEFPSPPPVDAPLAYPARQAPPPADKPASPSPGPVPTVRQAVQDYMAADSTADARTMLALGSMLGSGTRLDALGERATPAALRRWYRDTWGDRADLSPGVHRTLCGVFGFWTSREWLDENPTLNLQA